ncbi:arrestin domain-containing protein 4 isoform X1 [Bufo gargarizans]|uniref:arrestin domain-containing protein 4 isoform X1 n=2 Tax=Bufo gargarizans TaxID=30331 RepID=UPI001CF478F4|nr:arrestin domain-containing protein 4 isoform X1 [Bufo gargarizans]
MVGGVLMSIVLENERKYGYAAGESVSGQVILELLEDTQVLGLQLHARGGAFTSFTVKRGGEWVECLNKEITLLSSSAGETHMFTAGNHKLPFHLQLPNGPLVTSFTGKYGRVQYRLTAVLERPLVPAYSVHRELRVNSRIDVNSPPLLTPVQLSKEKMVGCWLCTSGPISLNAKIGRKGYCNGEAIPIYAEIENGSSRLVVPKAAIFQVQRFFVHGKMKTYRQMLARVRGNHIASGSTEIWNGKMLKIPPITPTITDCPIIRVEYVLAVYIHIPGAKKLMVELPLVIGTVPFNGFLYRNLSSASQFTVDMSWLALTLPEQPEAPPNYADIVSEEELSWRSPIGINQSDLIEGSHVPPFTMIQEFRFQPPPLYSEVDPHPDNRTPEQRTASFIL